MGKRRDKKKVAEEENQGDDIDSLAAEIENETSAPKQRRKKKKPVVDDWDVDDITEDMGRLGIKAQPSKEKLIGDEVDEDSDEIEDNNFAFISTKKGKSMHDLLDWDELGDDDDNDHESDDESVEKEKPIKQVTTQSKKGKKKKKKDDDWENDIEKELEMIASGQPPPAQDAKPDKSKGKKKKDRRKKDDDWEADIEKEMDLIATGQPPADEDKPAGDKQTKSKGKKEKKKRENGENDKVDDVEMAVEEVVAEEEKSRSKAKGKKSRKAKDDWEDDIEKDLEMIASGQAPAEEEKPDKSKQKGKRERKNREEKVEEKKPDAPSSSTEAQKKSGDNKDAQKTGKQGKKGRKNKNTDWEDEIAGVLAKIESGEPPEKDEGKKDASKSKSKKKKDKQEKKEPETEMAKQEEPVTPKPEPTPVVEAAAEGQAPAEEVAEPTATTTKKKKKKGKKDAEEEKAKKKPSKAIRLMQEALRKRKEEEERLKQEEEERLRKEEEAYQKKLAEIEEEKRRKEKKKQEKKARIQKQKDEGTYMTPSQREAKRRREAYLKALLEQGIQLPTKGQDTKLPKYDRRKKPEQKKPKQEPEAKVEEKKPEPIPVPEEIKVKEPEVEEEESEFEDDWEAMADKNEEKSKEADKDEDDEESSSVEEETSSSDEEESEEEEPLTAREKALNRINKLRDTNERNRTTKDLRSPVLCVMGHVDTGKTKILDKIRHTNVQDGEAGGITQQIGATNIPVQAIKEQTKMVKNFSNIHVPGLLVIDTPGHESFSNLRSRGSSNCDMAILVVDIMHGLEPQTIESINMLRKKKTPYVVALNKIDRLYQWKANPKADVETTIKEQSNFTMQEFQKRVNEIIVEFAQQNLNVKLFYENDDPDEWISMVPTSAHSGDGMGNLMAYVVQHCQTRLAKRLSFSENLQCTVLEVKAIQGLGTTVDVILTNGRLKYGDTIVLAGTEGPIVTHIKALLMPQPLKEMRVKNPYDHFKEVKAAQGVKVLAKELDKALAGTSLLIARHDDEINILKEDVQAEVDQALKGIKLQERGVFVQASTLGSLEALLEFLKQSKIPYAGINIGPVHKRDVMKASVMLEHDDQWAVILAFDVKVEREAQELADNLEVKIFTADIIYHLFDAFMKHREDLKRQKQDEFRHKAVFPCKLKIVPNCVFKSRDPIVVGVSIEAGQLRVGTPVCVPGKDFLNVGIVTSIENNHKSVDMARKPQEVCIKIDGAQGEAPKMVGRHFDENDILTSKISRDSIDLLKNWFRDDMQKSDWQLVIELKKLFEII